MTLINLGTQQNGSETLLGLSALGLRMEAMVPGAVGRPPAPPKMFVAGADDAEKTTVFGLVADLGISARDAGPLIVVDCHGGCISRELDDAP